MSIKMKSLFTVSALIVCLVAIFAFKFNVFSKTLKTVVVDANYVTYNSEEDLRNFADVVVIGTVSTDLKEDKVVTTKNDLGRLDDFYTITPFKIQKLIKGDVTDKTIYINQPVAITKDTDNSDVKVVLDGYSELKKNSKYVLYLKKSSVGNYSIVSVTQGKFNLDDTDKEEKDKIAENKQVSQLKEKVLKNIKTEQ
jgi:hypothetical protein